MGQCGCGDFQGDFKFKGPGNKWYVLQVYPPCDYCETPAGVILYKFNKKDQELWRINEIPEVEIQDIGTAVWVVDVECLKKDPVFEDQETDIQHAFLKAVNKAIKNNAKNLLKNKRGGGS